MLSGDQRSRSRSSSRERRRRRHARRPSAGFAVVHEDPDLNRPQCFNYIPTGRNCVQFYLAVLISGVIMTASVIALFIYTDCESRAMWTTLLTATIALWLPSPSMRPPMRDNHSDNSENV